MEKHFSKNNLSELTLRLKSVIDTAIDGIITIDKRGIVESMNPAAAKLFGYAIEEVIGNNVSMLMPNPHHDQHDEYISRYRRTRQPRIIGIGREVEGLRKDGSKFPMRLAVSEVDLGEKTIFTGIIHDLSNVKKAEAEVRKLNEHLEQKVKDRTNELAATVNKLLASNQQLEHEIKERKAAEKALRELLEKEKELHEMKSRFVSMASHQFRTPLSSVLSSTELIEAYILANKYEKTEKHLERIKAAIKNLTHILNDFLSLAKLEEGKTELQPSRFVISEFCKEVREETEGILKPGQVIEHSSNQPNEVVFLDKKLLKNIMFNLLSNAVKYSDPGQPILCNIHVFKDSKGKKQLRLKVTDQGIGIPKADQKHLFTRFFRAHNAENTQGTGLGLNIVRQYVELMDGTIDFESEEGLGSTFIIKIPLTGQI